MPNDPQFLGYSNQRWELIAIFKNLKSDMYIKMCRVTESSSVPGS